MIKVNEYMAGNLLGSLGGSVDKDDADSLYLLTVDGNDELQVKKVIKDYILPSFLSHSKEYQVVAKNSLAYFLTTNRMDFGYHFDS
jgi:hypothetical protein